MMRNNTYTVFRGEHLMLSDIRDDDDNVLLSYVGDDCPFSDFTKSKHGINRYVLIVEQKNINNAYKVRTMGKYRGYIFSVFSVEGSSTGMVFIGTSNKDVSTELNLLEINRNWYGNDINESELDLIWEERIPTRGLPMPGGLETKVFKKK